MQGPQQRPRWTSLPASESAPQCRCRAPTLLLPKPALAKRFLRHQDAVFHGMTSALAVPFQEQAQMAASALVEDDQQAEEANQGQGE